MFYIIYLGTCIRYPYRGTPHAKISSTRVQHAHEHPYRDGFINQLEVPPRANARDFV